MSKAQLFLFKEPTQERGTHLNNCWKTGPRRCRKRHTNPRLGSLKGWKITFSWESFPVGKFWEKGSQFSLYVMIEIGGEWGEFQHYMQRRGSPRREDSTVCTVCMGGGLVNGKCEHYGAFHTRPQTTGRPAFQGRSFCCVRPSGAWKPYPKVTSSQMPYHLSQPLSVSTTYNYF